MPGQWDESKHKRGQPGNKGQFGPGGGGGASSSGGSSPGSSSRDQRRAVGQQKQAELRQKAGGAAVGIPQGKLEQQAGPPKKRLPKTVTPKQAAQNIAMIASGEEQFEPQSIRELVGFLAKMPRQVLESIKHQYEQIKQVGQDTGFTGFVSEVGSEFMRGFRGNPSSQGQDDPGPIEQNLHRFSDKGKSQIMGGLDAEIEKMRKMVEVDPLRAHETSPYQKMSSDEQKAFDAKYQGLRKQRRELASSMLKYSREFEQQHPRADDGKFAEKHSSGSTEQGQQGVQQVESDDEKQKRWAETFSKMTDAELNSEWARLDRKRRSLEGYSEVAQYLKMKAINKGYGKKDYGPPKGGGVPSHNLEQHQIVVGKQNVLIAETRKRERPSKNSRGEDMTHAEQNEARQSEMRIRAQRKMEQRLQIIEDSATPVQDILVDPSINSLDRLKMARRELDRQIRNERAEQRKQPIVVNVNIPEIKIPAITMPELKPTIQVDLKPEITMPEMKAAQVTVNVPKPDPVVVNMPKAEPPKEFDIVPVRNEDGDVVRFNKVPRGK